MFLGTCVAVDLVLLGKQLNLMILKVFSILKDFMFLTFPVLCDKPHGAEGLSLVDLCRVSRGSPQDKGCKHY